jgi:hypothetical protein
MEMLCITVAVTIVNGMKITLFRLNLPSFLKLTSNMKLTKEQFLKQYGYDYGYNGRIEELRKTEFARLQGSENQI